MTSRQVLAIACGSVILLTWCAARGRCASAITQPVESSDESSADADSIRPGTAITMQNWQSYRRFMPSGMVALFEGKYFWKMPPDVQMQVGSTIINPLPKNYVGATEKYAGQVRINELADGGLTMEGYRGGIPFPNPQEPHQGWKVLMNLWYRYSPHLLVTSQGWLCAVDSLGASNCETFQGVIRQLTYNTDVSSSPEPAVAESKYFTGWVMMLGPERLRYVTSLRINYAELTRPEEVYGFVPSLHARSRFRSLHTCARILDWTEEDLRGIDSNMTQLQANYISRKKILALLDFSAPDGIFPNGLFMPLMWPRPSWSQWQLRDVDVISVEKIPSKAGRYCYGKRVIYVDVQTSTPLWEELYDPDGRLWKFLAIFPQRVNEPGTGPVLAPGAELSLVWDIQRNHASAAGESAKSIYINEQAPAEFQDVVRYTTPAGLELIMR
jgi:Protein of unknown function (DUF1329)